MLYDPKWERPVKTRADPFTLPALIAWLERQPAGEAYDWLNIHGCLACRYFQSLGHKTPWGNSYQLAEDGYKTPFGGRENYHKIAGAKPWTFGAALDRARAIAAR